MADRLEGFDSPVIAAVNGYALGGGCELALACDMRLASERARFGQPEINLGIVPGWGGSQRLPRLVSPGYAKQMILTGAPIDAAEALRVGLVNHVHPPEELLDRAVELAATIAAKPVWAAAAAKEMCNRALDGDLAGGLAREIDIFALAFTTPDQREGMDAFFEKRPASFA
jgi:enoyl-CoA hydratase